MSGNSNPGSSGTGQPATKRPRGERSGSDRFCWVCHTNEPEPLWKCEVEGCLRAYHIRCCVKDMPTFPRPNAVGPENAKDPKELTLLECPECLVANPDNQLCYPTLGKRSQADVSRIMSYLGPILRASFVNNPYIDILKSEGPNYQRTVRKVVDIRSLERKIEAGEIRTLEGFFGELKWLEHNAIIFHGFTSEQVKQVKELIEAAKDELKIAVKCPDCYFHVKSRKDDKDKEWFLKPCNPPHLLVWAKVPSYPWWPSKVKHIQGDMVSIRFFGDHTRAEVPLKQCRLFSANGGRPPEGKKKGDHAKLMRKALKEIADHITELEKVYGPVALPASSERPMVTVLNTDSVRVMFPNYQD